MIDCVITWVDGDDPVFRERMEAFLTDRHEEKLSDVAGEVRFSNGGEIYLAVASVIRFAPFIGRIFVITDGQDPKLDEFMARYFPESRVRIILVDHKVIFDGFESYLPTFNSLSIETLMWRIPDLSREFIYLNDDIFFTAPAVAEDFFRQGKVVCPHPRYPVWVADFLTWIRRRRADGRKRFTYKDSLRNGSTLIGAKQYYHIKHTPVPIRKDILAGYYAHHPEDILLNIAHRFRDNAQYNNQQLFLQLARRQGLLIEEKAPGNVIQLRPSPRKHHYMRRKMRRINRMPRLKYACMNALSACSDEDRRLFWEWASALVGVPLATQ